MALRDGLRAHLAQRQHRNGYSLLLNNAVGAVTGLLFWLVLARVLGLSEQEVGVGYALIALASMVAVLAKGGLDTALLRAAHGRSHRDASAVHRQALLLATAVTVGVVLAMALLAPVPASPDPSPLGWLLVAAIAALLVAGWLQDARFLAAGDAWPSLQRNLALGASKVVFPFVAVLAAVTHAVAVSLALALAVSLAIGAALARRRPRPDSGLPRLPPRAFLLLSMRNAASSAAESLPGLLLAPMVFAIAGAASAAHFGMAWTAAALLFLSSAALARSALAEMVRDPSASQAALRRAALQHAVLVLPAAAVGAALAGTWLSFFGSAYAEAASSALALLATSIVLVAPGNLHLATLRARDRPLALAAYPLAMIGLLAVTAPLLLDLWGLPGVAVAWIVANLPLGIAGWVTVARVLRREPAPAVGTDASGAPKATGGLQ